MRRKTVKNLTRSSRMEYLLALLNREYSAEKTMEDYEQFLKGKTYDRGLIDKTLKEWQKELYEHDKTAISS